jgi:hypothetical protein
VNEAHLDDDICSSNPACISADVPFLKGIRTGLIDPDTPENVKTRKDINGKTQTLAFSDEFNDEGRTFYDGDDPFWLAMDFWYGVTMDLEVSLFPGGWCLRACIDPSNSGTTLMQLQPQMALWPFSSMLSKTTT